MQLENGPAQVGLQLRSWPPKLLGTIVVPFCVPVVSATHGFLLAALWPVWRFLEFPTEAPSHISVKAGLRSFHCSSPCSSCAGFLYPFSTRCTLAGLRSWSSLASPSPAACRREGPAIPQGLCLINLCQRVSRSVTWGRAQLTPHRSRDCLHRHFPFRVTNIHPCLSVI